MVWETDSILRLPLTLLQRKTIAFLKSSHFYSCDSLGWRQRASFCTTVLNQKPSFGRGNEKELSHIWRERTEQDGMIPVSLRAAVRLLWTMVITHLKANASTTQGPLVPAGGFFYYRAFMCHIKSVYQAFCNHYLLFLIATLHYAPALPFKPQGAAAGHIQYQPSTASSWNLLLGFWFNLNQS